MGTKFKVYLALFLAAAAVVSWFIFKETIVAAFWTVAVGSIVLAGIYVGARVWWWKRKRSRLRPGK